MSKLNGLTKLSILKTYTLIHIAYNQNMKLDFVRFETPDYIELQGWLSDTDGDVAVIHVHGMSGNGYENTFLDTLHQTYNKLGISMFSIDNRGRGVMSTFWQNNPVPHNEDSVKLGGSCFEVLEECVHDIQGAIDYLKSLGKRKFILQGHSLGCTKVVYYMNTQRPDDVTKVVLLAPTDMVAWASRDSMHLANIQRARQLMSENQPTALVSAQCWPDKTPLSAQTYLSICVAGTPADIYGTTTGRALLATVAAPMLIAYGSNDIGITEISGTVEAWRKKADSAINHEYAQIEIIDGASHSFKDHEDALSQIVCTFTSK